MMIIGIVGRSIDPEGRTCSIGTGKDTAANRLVDEHGFIKVALADEMKRFLRRIGVPDPNLWGPSGLRDEPLEVLGGKSARHALKTLGTEWGRELIDQDLWVRHTMTVVDKLEQLGSDAIYREDKGVTITSRPRAWRVPRPGVVISDVRLPNEVAAIRNHGGKILLVSRPVDKLPDDADLSHVSETELQDIGPDLEIENTGTLEDLRRAVDQAARQWGV